MAKRTMSIDGWNVEIVKGETKKIAEYVPFWRFEKEFHCCALTNQCQYRSESDVWILNSNGEKILKLRTYESKEHPPFPYYGSVLGGVIEMASKYRREGRLRKYLPRYVYVKKMRRRDCGEGNSLETKVYELDLDKLNLDL